MRVWLIQIGEPLPVDGPHVRLLRSGILAETLVAQGHEVVWWSAAFSHFAKSHRTPGESAVRLGPQWTLRLLPSCGYARNVSLARLRDHAQVARAFARLAPQERPPDIVVSNLPTPGLCCAAADYAGPRGIPLVLDLRDQWPDVFLDLLPRPLRPAGRLALLGLFRRTAEACRRATCLIGVTDGYLEWGLRYAGRARAPRDAVLPIGYRRRGHAPAVLDQARAFWDARGVRVADKTLTVCFFGTLGRQFAIPAVIDAARSLPADAVRFVLCGDGDMTGEFRQQARGLRNVLFPGRIDAPEIHALMERSHVGLAPYRRTSNFAGHIPNKPAEYLSARLPIVSSLSEGLDALLDRYQCGFTYAPDDSGQLAEILGRLARDRRSLQAMAGGAGRLFADHFDADKIYPAYVEHLERVARLPAAPRRAA